MGRRAESVDLTRQRITDAAVRLHTTVGPSATSMSAVAAAAGITRLTLYRHFPSKDALFGACMGHWRSLHPPPDPDAWRAISSFRARAATAIDELYGWYAQNGDELYPIYRDAAFTPQSNERARRATNDRIVAAVLGDASPARGRAERPLKAALGHVVSFWTWRSLAVEQSLSTERAAWMALQFVLAVGEVD
jgi:AcrR family transcriptional regulator